jgi:hypothetical protein
MGSQHHMIRRGVLEVELAGTEAEGVRVQRRLAELCRDGLARALERGLDGAAPPEEDLWVIDRMAVDLGSVPLERLEHDFADALIQAVGRQIRERAAGLGGSLQRPGRTAAGVPATTGEAASASPSPADRRRTPAEAAFEAFAYFLRTGALPWWYRLPEGEAFETAIMASWPKGVPPPAYGRLATDLSAPAALRTRLVRQFSAPFLDALLSSVWPDGAQVVRAILARLERDATEPAELQATEALWRTAFARASAGPGGPAADQVFALWLASGTGVEELLRAVAIPEPVPPPPQGEAKPGRPAEARLDLDEGVYVECAGLVLLHPFLPRLFEVLELTSGADLVRPDRALGLLHFLATGERLAPEHTLVLPKRLCSLPLEAPAPAPSPLTPAEEDEATAMLQAVVSHWGALGDASVDALRGTFLTRPGKLSHRGEDEILQVEPQSFDILLDQLPWGIGAVRLPWMTDILWVEWTH